MLFEGEGHTLTGFEKVVKELEQNKRPVKLGDQQVAHELIAPVAIGATFFNPTEQIVWADNDTVFQFNKEEARQKNIFMRFGMAMLIFFLVLLFGNYVYLGQLNQTIVDNATYLDDYQEQLGEISTLEDEKNRKERLLQSSGLLNRNFLSYYLMEIGNSVPAAISLDNINVRPISGEIKKRKKIDFQEHKLFVSGRSSTSQILSNWIAEIEDYEWLTKVEILNYAYTKNEGVFELEMIVL